VHLESDCGSVSVVRGGCWATGAGGVCGCGVGFGLHGVRWVGGVGGGGGPKRKTEIENVPDNSSRIIEEKNRVKDEPSSLRVSVVALGAEE